MPFRRTLRTARATGLPPGLRAAALLGALVGSCGGSEDEPPRSPGQAADGQAPRTLLLGDSLLHAPERLRVERLPAGNLSADVTRLLQGVGPGGTVRVRTAPLPSEIWSAGRPVPETFAGIGTGRDDLRLFRCTPALPGAADVVPTILRDGAPVTTWAGPEDGPFPGELLFWDGELRELRAVAAAAPHGIQLEAPVTGAAELGAVERSLRAPAGEERTAPAPRDLMRRAELGRVSRPCLLAPAPGALAIEVPALPLQALAVSVGVLDHAWRASGDALERTSGLSDGADFAIEVEAGGARRRLWSATLGRADVGARFVDAEVDLSPFAGQAFTLHLLTGPGPAADADFDYAVWSDLRLLGAARRRPGRPSVVIIDADTLRPDRLGCYGGRRPTSPRLDQWAAQSGVRFSDVRSTGCYTLPATATMLSGLAVHQHRLGQGVPTLAAGGAESLAARLSAAGWETLGIAEGAYLSTSFGFDQGFDVYVTRDSKKPGWELARDWMEDRRRRSERPFFLFLQTYTVHAPYDYDPRFLDAEAPYTGPLAGKPIGIDTVLDPVREKQRKLDAADLAYVNALYDAGVARIDALAGGVLDAVRETLADEEALVIFTADHGEEFLEHGSMAHNHTLYNELLAVPLIVDLPGPAPAGVSDTPVSLLDVVPTVLDVLGLPAPETLPGRSLREEPSGARRGAPRPRIAQYSPVTHCLEMDGWKLIRGRTVGSRAPLQLFDLRADPGEQHDLSAEQPDRVAALGKLLDDWLAQWPVPEVDLSQAGGVDARTLQDLNALGYAGDKH